MLNALLFLGVLVPHALTQTIHREPYGVTYNAGNEMHIRVRESENRDPLFCEPYEEMYIDEDDCNIYCMLNAKLGNVAFRDRARRRLQTCLSSTMPCGLCRRRVFVNGVPQNMNASVPGKCVENCQCSAHVPGAAQLTEMAKECQALKLVKFQPYRKQLQTPQIDGFEFSLPSPERRDRTRCEAYETTSYSVPVGSQEVYDLQCKALCVVSGSIGSLQIKSPPRQLGLTQGSQCRQPTVTSLYNGIEVIGSQEQLVGFCNRGACSQMTRSNLRPRSMPTNDRPISNAFHKVARISVNVSEGVDSVSSHHGANK